MLVLHRTRQSKHFSLVLVYTPNGVSCRGPKPKAAAKAPAPAPAAAPPVSAKRARTKKGPKRVHKIVRKTANQLDQEMEDYRAAIGTSKEVDAAMAG